MMMIHTTACSPPLIDFTSRVKLLEPQVVDSADDCVSHLGKNLRKSAELKAEAADGCASHRKGKNLRKSAELKVEAADGCASHRKEKTLERVLN